MEPNNLVLIESPKKSSFDIFLEIMDLFVTRIFFKKNANWLADKKPAKGLA